MVTIKQYKNIDEYIAAFPEDIQDILQSIRKTIKKSAPKAMENISYGMPAFKQNKNLVYFAAFKNHIGFFPTPSAILAFKKELIHYETSKGTIRFPKDKQVPLKLVEKIVKFRVKEELTIK